MAKAGEIMKSGKLFTLLSIKENNLKLPPLPSSVKLPL